jgi:hypothetical protein
VTTEGREEKLDFEDRKNADTEKKFKKLTRC